VSGISRLSVFAALAVLVVAGPAGASGGDCRRAPVYTARCFDLPKPHRSCDAVAHAAAPCFAVRGRVYAANGAPAIRLSRAGTRRIFGVVGGEGDPASPTLLPPALRAAMTPTQPGSLQSVEGDFRVCPLATGRAGWMQPVCIASAAHLVVAR
jgi:hypothetical protein